MATDGQQLPEVGVRRYDASTGLSGCSHHVEVGGAEQIQIADVNGIMSGVAHQLRYSARQRLVDEEPHPAAGSGSSRSSTAAAA